MHPPTGLQCVQQTKMKKSKTRRQRRWLSNHDSVKKGDNSRGQERKDEVRPCSHVGPVNPAGQTQLNVPGESPWEPFSQTPLLWQRGKLPPSSAVVHASSTVMQYDTQTKYSSTYILINVYCKHNHLVLWRCCLGERKGIHPVQTMLQQSDRPNRD